MLTSKSGDMQIDADASLRAILAWSGSGHAVDAALIAFQHATTMEIIALERSGVAAGFLVDLGRRMGLSNNQIFQFVGLSKASARSHIRANRPVRGVPGIAAVAIIQLACDAQRMINDSKAPAARGFDAMEWLGQWLVLPQPALAGSMPFELLDTSTGIRCVSSVFGAISSGAYQ
jgi:hypothetical protein